MSTKWLLYGRLFLFYYSAMRSRPRSSHTFCLAPFPSYPDAQGIGIAIEALSHTRSFPCHTVGPLASEADALSPPFSASGWRTRLAHHTSYPDVQCYGFRERSLTFGWVTDTEPTWFGLGNKRRCLVSNSGLLDEGHVRLRAFSLHATSFIWFIWNWCRRLYMPRRSNHRVSAWCQKVPSASEWEVKSCDKTSVSDKLRLRKGCPVPINDVLQ